MMENNKNKTEVENQKKDLTSGQQALSWGKRRIEQESSKDGDDGDDGFQR